VSLSGFISGPLLWLTCNHSGQNKAAIEVAKREGRDLNGAKYEIYGVDEETLWDRIDSMEDWWKETTWTRLIQRELPDL
jgi:TBC1 domain family member 14